MYTTSEAYNNAIKGSRLKNRVEMTVTTLSGDVYNITDENILAGSMNISNQCQNGSDIALGSVHVGQLTVTLYRLDTSRYNLYNGTISAKYFLDLGNGQEEEIPLGTWQIAEATRRQKTIAIKAYDAMVKMDKLIARNTEGTPWELLNEIAYYTGIRIGNTKNQIEAMPNGHRTMRISMEQIDTYRSALAYITSCLAGFATIGKDNKLYIKQYMTTPIYAITDSQRISTSVYDYQTYFVNVKGRFIIAGKYSEISTHNEIDGLEYDLGNIPVIYGDKDAIESVLENILDRLKTIVYTPIKTQIISNPAIELGDMIDFQRIEGEQNCSSLITKITWIYHGKNELTSAGSDPYKAKVSDRVTKAINAATRTDELYISEVNRLNPQQIEVVATDGAAIVSNVWTITEEHGITKYINLTNGRVISFEGWEENNGETE